MIVGGGEAGALMRSIDWATTRLGPADGWPQSLRTAINICVCSRFPIALYWGPEFVMLYNDALLPMVGANKHPAAMGRPAFEVLPEIRDLIEPLLLSVVTTGESIWSEDLMLPLLRRAVQEEAYFTFTYSPIRDEAGAVGGVFCAVLETTDKVIEGRRLRLLNALAGAAQASSPAEACAEAAAQIAHATSDVPFALIYLLDAHGGSSATLAGAANIAPGDPRAPTTIVLGDGAVWPFDPDASAPRTVALEAGPAGARGAVILAIERAGGGRSLGFLVAGLSQLLRSAESYDRFHTLLAASVSQTVSNAAAYQSERQRVEALAEIPRGAAHLPADQIHASRSSPPVARDAELYVDEAVRWALPATGAVGALEPATVAGGERIVFADDNADMREYVGRLLGERWDVEVVGDGAAALTAIARRPPALVLCDVMMPILDGLALVKLLRADPALRTIPVMFLSARAGEEETARGLSLGANDYIAKPFSARELLVRVASQLAAARVAEEMRVREQRQRENLYRHFMQAPFPVSVLRGPAHVIELANPAMLAAWGRGLRIVGLPLRDALPELRDQPFLGYLDRVFETGVAYEGNAEVVRFPTGPDGAIEDRYFNFVHAPLRDPSGAIEGTLVSAFDVTQLVEARLARARLLEEEQRARREAEAARARLHSLFMQAPVPICILEGPDHRYTLANQPLMTLVGRDDLIGKSVAEAFPDRIEAGLIGLLDRVYATGEAFRRNELPMDLVRRAGGPFEPGLFNVVYEPFRDLEGGVCGVVAVVFDVTDVVLARRASEQARRDAEAASEAQRAVLEFQERFVAVLGHDLRNPLAAIDIAAGLLRQQMANPDAAVTERMLGRIRSSSQRMSRMVEQILDLTRSRIGGGLVIEPAEVELGPVLAGIVEELRTAHPDRKIELACPSTTGRWDGDRLEQVFSNLIGNAIHHGSPESPVTVNARLTDSAVCVEVHNLGPEIPETLRVELFSAFRRGGRESRGPKTAGLGLGLYISRELVIAHGGTIEVRSSTSGGTTFSVTLPVEVPFSLQPKDPE